MTQNEALAIRDAAQLLLEHMTADIRHAQTRIEHNRLTILASEAEHLVATINSLVLQ